LQVIVGLIDSSQSFLLLEKGEEGVSDHSMKLRFVPKVSDFESDVSIKERNEDVSSGNVSVDDALLVDVLETFTDLACKFDGDGIGRGLWEIVQVRSQVSS
jgi:hypothetical protein